VTRSQHDPRWRSAAPYEKPKLASTEIKGDADKPLQQKLVIEFVRGPGK
jgi:hypothetical protein